MKRTTLLVLMIAALLAGTWTESARADTTVGPEQLADYSLLVPQEWKKYDWLKDGKKQGWRLRYQPGGMDVSQSALSVSLAAGPKTGANKDEVYAAQVRALKALKNNHTDGFAVQNMVLANDRTLVLRYYRDGGTVVRKAWTSPRRYLPGMPKPTGRLPRRSTRWTAFPHTGP